MVATNRERIDTVIERLESSNETPGELLLIKELMESSDTLIEQVEGQIGDNDVDESETKRLFMHLNNNFSAIFSGNRIPHVFDILAVLTNVDRVYSTAELKFIENALQLTTDRKLTQYEKEKSVCIRILNKLALLGGHGFESIFAIAGRVNAWQSEVHFETKYQNKDLSFGKVSRNGRRATINTPEYAINTNDISELKESIQNSGKTKGYIGLQYKKSSFNDTLEKLVIKQDYNFLGYLIDDINLIEKEVKKLDKSGDKATEIEAISAQLTDIKEVIYNQRKDGLHKSGDTKDLLYKNKDYILNQTKTVLDIAKLLEINKGKKKNPSRKAFDEIQYNLLRTLDSYEEGSDIIRPNTHIAEHIGSSSLEYTNENLTDNQPLWKNIYDKITQNPDNPTAIPRGKKAQAIIEKYIDSGAVNIIEESYPHEGSETVVYNEVVGTKGYYVSHTSKVVINDEIFVDYVHKTQWKNGRKLVRQPVIREVPLIAWMLSDQFVIGSYYTHREEDDLSEYAQYTEDYKEIMNSRKMKIKTYKDMFAAFEELGFHPDPEFFEMYLATASNESSMMWDPYITPKKKEKILQSTQMLEDALSIKLGESLDKADLMWMFLTSNEKKEIKPFINKYKKLLSGKKVSEFDIYVVNQEFVPVLKKHLERTRWSLDAIALPYIGGLKNLIDDLEHKPDTIGLWQTNVDFLIEDITLGENPIINKYPKLKNLLQSPKILRDTLVKDLSGMETILSKREIFKLIFEVQFQKRYNNHNLTDKDGNKVPGNLDYFIVENFTGELSTYFAAFQRTLNLYFSGSLQETNKDFLKIDGDLVFYKKHSRQIDWEKTRSKSQSYNFLIERRKELGLGNISTKKMEGYIEEMVLAGTYEKLQQTKLYEAVMRNVALNSRRMIPKLKLKDLKVTNPKDPKGAKILFDSNVYIHRVRQRARPDIDTEKLEKKSPEVFMVNYLKTLSNSQRTESIQLIKQFTGIEIKVGEIYRINTHNMHESTVSMAIKNLQQVLRAKKVDRKYGPETDRLLKKLPKAPALMHGAQLDTSHFIGQPSQLNATDGIEIASPDGEYVIWHLHDSNLVKEYIKNNYGPVFTVGKSGKKTPVMLSYGNHMNSAGKEIKKTVPDRVSDSKELFVVHGSGDNDNDTINGGATTGNNAYIVSSNSSMISNFNPIYGQGGLGNKTKFKNAGLNEKINHDAIALEISLAAKGEGTAGINKRRIDLVTRPTDSQKIAVKNSFLIAQAQVQNELYGLASQDATFNEKGEVIPGAHGDQFSDQEMKEMGFQSIKYRQEYIEKKYRKNTNHPTAVHFYANFEKEFKKTHDI